MEDEVVLSITALNVQKILIDTPDPYRLHNGLYSWEIALLTEKGYDYNNFVISGVTNGLSTRSPKDIERASFKCLDLYEIHLNKKPDFSIHRMY